jgi:hypothetical protein
MSFFTDFLIATEADAPEIASSEKPTEQWPGFSAKSITELDLANVWSILSAAPDVTALHGRFEHIYFDPDGECTITKMPSPFVELLAEVEDANLPAMSARWAQAPEFDEMRDLSQLQEMLRNLRDLAKRALADRREILVFTYGS